MISTNEMNELRASEVNLLILRALMTSESSGVYHYMLFKRKTIKDIIVNTEQMLEIAEYAASNYMTITDLSEMSSILDKLQDYVDQERPNAQV